MNKLLSFLKKTPRELTICENHDPKKIPQINPTKQPVPYAKDHCKTCNIDICHVCSQQHVFNHCQVKCNIYPDLGTGILKKFNYGSVVKVNLNGLRCICGKPLGSSANICAACGLASCSESCHSLWEKAGKCIFSENFYSMPPGFSMRSILFENILKLQKAKVSDWAIANRSSTTMICCYVHGQHDHVLLQRGYRIYGNPNDELIERMELLPDSIDRTIHYDRLCDCKCENCTKNSQIHSVNNCQKRCIEFDLDYMRNASMKAQNHKQCTCSCDFCNSGVILSTHRQIDCMPYCQRSSYWREYKKDV